MKAIALIGNKKSGKTSLAQELCAYFQTQGLKVAAAKYSSHGFERQDTDTARLSEQAQAVVGISPKESLIIWPRKRFLLDLVPLLQADVLVVEGGRELTAMPRILLPKNAGQDDRPLEPELALAAWKQCPEGDLPVIDNIQDLGQLVLERGFLLPGLDCGSCGREDCGQLARDIVHKKANPDDCQALQGTMTVRVNGQALGLNPFVESIISGGIQGMLAQLKGYAPGRIEISMEL
ncbi:MAG: molybdopterin-guanine dinucleotide biosynthesis protein MobB [Thermodesulfobacteriota bacterium]